MANIQKRGEYQYQADIRRKGFPRQTQTFLTKDDAERWVRKHEGQMDEGKFRDLRPVAKLTLGDALDRYMEEVVPTKAVGGQRNERNRIRLLKKHPLARRELSTLQSSDFAKYRNERTAQVGSANTVRLELALLSHLYTIGKKEWNWPLDNPLKDVRRPSAPEGRERRLRGDEETRLLSGVSDARVRQPVWLEACIRLSLATGLRAGELLTLEWSQVDLKGGVMNLTKDRNGSKRSVGLNLEAVRVLESLPRSTEKVIKGYHETGKLDCDFKATCVAAGLIDLHFHDLRHEAATRLAPHMMPQELAKIMGWKTLQMAMRYYNPTAQELATRMRAVEAARSEPSPGVANALAVPRTIELASGPTAGGMPSALATRPRATSFECSSWVICHRGLALLRSLGI
ncbi:tyrosine-type recombinase/integrase [Bordetella bronchiseptica]|uniref:tyrosine-type recombinase/integrase n=1 Tax=Bordetella bronchiseptica TaxID=518 RepID=UPI0009B8C9D6|nr:site-specific integrase [Bordetella bronchiseptica]